MLPWSLLSLASFITLLAAGNPVCAISVSSSSSSLTSSAPVLRAPSSSSSLRSMRPIWLPEHLIYPHAYRRKPVMLLFRGDSSSAGEIAGSDETAGGGIEEATTAPSSSSGPQIITVSGVKQPKNSDFRLPTALRPVHYVLRVQPFINGNYSVHGTVQIEIEVLRPTSNITLHAIAMNIHTKDVQLEAAEDDESGAAVPRITHFIVDEDVEFFSAQLEGELEAGRRVRYTVPYEASLDHYLNGFYGAPYAGKDGTLRQMVSSLHQPISARTSFPCFDEPGLKATFDLHVAREVNMTALSNMPLQATTPKEDQKGWVWDSFQTTPPMSTYLLMLAVFSFPYINITAHRPNLPIRVWARQEVLDKASHLQQVVPRILNYMENYTNISYSLPKLDIIAVPGSEGAAFEGWGIVFMYDESAVMHDPLENNAEKKWMNVVTFHAHELVHQWFGNLVTPRWWTDEWLSEGVTTYISDRVIKETSLMSQEVLENEGLTHSEIFLHDEKVDAVSLHNKLLDIYNPKTYFTFITYFKGWAILHMMAHVLSHRVLRDGMRSFLQQHQYGSVEQDDLSRHLTKAAHEAHVLPRDITVKTILDSWTHQSSYPLVTVTRSPSGTSATAFQEKYFWSQNESLPGDHFNTWWVPLTYTTQASPDFNDTRVKAWLKATETQTPLHNLPPKHHWIIFNVQRTGYYRVNYDTHNWNLLIRQLLTDHQVIDVSNRAQMVDDVLKLASIGKVSYKIALNLMEYIKNETEMLPLRTFYDSVEHIRKMLHNTPASEGFKTYMWSLFMPLWNLLGIGKNKDVEAIQRKHSEAVRWMCSHNLPSCVHLASSLYSNWMLNPKDIQAVPKDLWGTVYCTAVANGGEAEWDFAWHQYFLSNDKYHKEQLLRALSCSRDAWKEIKYLDLAFTPGVKLRTEEAFQVFNSVASRPGGEHLAWNFLTRRWSAVAALYTDGGEAAEQLVVTAAETFNSRQDMDELRIFRDSHKDDPRVVAASEVALNIVAKNINWMERSYDDISEWLDTRGFYTTLRTP